VLSLLNSIKTCHNAALPRTIFKIRPKCSISFLQCIIRISHLLSPYLLHFPPLLPCLQLIFTTTSGHGLGTFRVENFVSLPCNKCTASRHTHSSFSSLSFFFNYQRLRNTEQRNRRKLRPYALILWTKNKYSAKLKCLGKKIKVPQWSGADKYSP